MSERECLAPKAHRGVEVSEPELNRRQVTGLGADYQVIPPLAVEIKASAVEIPGSFVITSHASRLGEAVKRWKRQLLVPGRIRERHRFTAPGDGLARGVVPQTHPAEAGSRSRPYSRPTPAA